MSFGKIVWNQVAGLFRTMGNKPFLLGLLVLLLLSYSWAFGRITVPNERSRAYLTSALVDDGTLSIDQAVRRFGHTVDVAKCDGRFYTDKAPGSSLLGALVYGTVRLFTPADAWSITDLVNLMRTWLMIPIGMLGFFLIRRFLSSFDIDGRVVDIVSLGWILASPAYHYSTAFYGHQIVAVFLLLSLMLILRCRTAESVTRLSMLCMAGAGLAAGIAGITEYQAVFPGIVFFVYAVVINRRHPVHIAAFVAGALPFAILLLGYNWLAFGGPFELPYHHLAARSMRVQHEFGVGGVTYPKMRAVLGTLFSLHRGILFTAPIFFLFPVGLCCMFKNRQHPIDRPLAVVTLTIFCFFLYFVFSAHVWHGGWGFGPRLLVPVLALAALPVAWAVNRVARNAVGAGVIMGMVVFALFYHQVVHLVYQEPPDFSQNPMPEIIFPALARGIAAPNLAAKLTGRPGLWNLIPALLLTVAAAGFVIWQVLSLQAGRMKRVFAILVSTGVVAAFTLTVVLVGTIWTARESEKFVNGIERDARAEYGASYQPPKGAWKLKLKAKPKRKPKPKRR